MRMVDEITLRVKTETSRVGGIPTYTNTDTVVYADVKSATRSEWSAQNQAGHKADIVFSINADEYADQTEAIYNTTTYRVLRAYRIGRGRIELTCEAMK